MFFTFRLSYIIIFIFTFPVILSIINSNESMEENNNAKTDHDNSKFPLGVRILVSLLTIFFAAAIFFICVCCILIQKLKYGRNLSNLELEVIQERRRLSNPFPRQVTYYNRQVEDEREDERKDEHEDKREDKSEDEHEDEREDKSEDEQARYSTASEQISDNLEIEPSISIHRFERTSARNSPDISGRQSTSSSSVIIIEAKNIPESTYTSQESTRRFRCQSESSIIDTFKKSSSSSSNSSGSQSGSFRVKKITTKAQVHAVEEKED